MAPMWSLSHHNVAPLSSCLANATTTTSKPIYELAPQRSC